MIRYTASTEGLTPEAVRGFFEGWPSPPSPERHIEILEASYAVVLAVDDDAGRVVGFVTAISDGVLAAYIPLLEVLPEYRGNGIGRVLMETILSRLDGLYMVDLVATPGRESFYERLHFRGARAMVHRDFEAQAGRSRTGAKTSHDERKA